MRVFLGGTCNGSTWRQRLIELLKIDYFNPVVDDWNEEAYQRELFERKHCDFVLYTITPKMTGVYSIAEAVDDSNKRPERTIFCILREDDGMVFTDGQLRSLMRVGQMINENGGKVFYNLNLVAHYLNESVQEAKTMALKVSFDITILVKAFFEAIDTLNEKGIQRAREAFYDSKDDVFNDLEWLEDHLEGAADEALRIDI